MKPYLLHHLLEESAGRYPERDAVAWQGRSLTYAELGRKSRALACALRERGVAPGDRVGLCMNKSLDAVAAIFGILAAGAAYVPIDVQSPAGRVDYILGSCGIRVLFASPEGAGRVARTSAGGSSRMTVVVAGEAPKDTAGGPGSVEYVPMAEILTGGGDAYARFDFADTNPAYILHTSGSTGAPKGVGLSHLNALTFVDMAAEYFRVGSGDRLACHAPLPFDLTVFDIFVAIGRGATIVLVPESTGFFPARLAQFIDEAGITVWNSVASVLSMLAERGRMERFRYDALRTMIFSGDVLPVKHLRKLKTLLPRVRLFNVYGQTEANSSMCHPVDDVPEGDAWKIPIGRAFPNFEVFALDEEGRVVDSPGRTGELHVRGSSVAMGYWGDAERTAESFVPDPRSRLSNRRVYRTGDLVTLDPEGRYVFIGRRDHQVKSRGYRVQLNEIEAVLCNHPGVKEAAAVAVPDDLLGNRIVSHVVPVDGTTLSEPEVLEYCGRILPAYMVPEKVFFLDRFPKTSTGKTDRKVLLESVKGRLA